MLLCVFGLFQFLREISVTLTANHSAIYSQTDANIDCPQLVTEQGVQCILELSC